MIQPSGITCGSFPGVPRSSPIVTCKADGLAIRPGAAFTFGATGWRSHISMKPAARQISPASVSARATSDVETAGATATVTIIVGGVKGKGEAESAGAESSAAMARPVAISILSAIDGSDRQKFDVRSRDDRTGEAHSVQI